MASLTSAYIPLLSLPSLVVATVVGHVSKPDRLALLRTCKALRQAVLQQAPRLTLHIDRLKSERSVREAAAVLCRQMPMDTLIINTGDSDHVDNCSHLGQQLDSELAQAQRTCAVSTLIVMGVASTCAGLVTAFPTITALELWQVELDSSMLQGLAQCTELVKLFLSHCLCALGVVPQDIASGLPAVRDLTLTSGEYYTQQVCLWLTALAPQLRQLVLNEQNCYGPEGLNGAALSALARCKQLEEISLSDMHQDTLDTLLELPSLTKVSCTPGSLWHADADGQRCCWAHVSLPTIQSVREADALPRGIDTLTLGYLSVVAAATPAASLAASQVLADAVLRSCHRLSWAEGAFINISTSLSPPNLIPDCVEAILQGLATLQPFLNNLKVKVKTLTCEEALIHALQTASRYTRHLHVQSETMSPRAWAALPATLPCTHECTFIVGALSEDSIAALGALCRDPGVAGGSTALRKITVDAEGWQVDEVARTKASLAQLQRELRASGAPVKLFVGFSWIVTLQ